MLELKPNRNVIEVLTGLSARPLVLEFRLPEPEERVAFRASQHVRDGGRIITRLLEPRLEFGLAILTGFESGCLAVDGKAISSDPASPDYCPEWKTLLVRVAPQAVEALAVRVFETAVVLRCSLDRPATPAAKAEEAPAGPPDVALEGDVEDAAPLASTSGGR